MPNIALPDIVCNDVFGLIYPPSRAAEQVVQGWMDSPGHRENILEKQYDKSGIGVAVNNYMVYVTQYFC